MTMSLPAPRTASNVGPNPLTGHRLACALIRETRAELLLFVARMPGFRAEIDAAPCDAHGWKDGDDIDSVEYDTAGLADLLDLVGQQLPHAGEPTRVYAPVPAPAAYCDALALIVARVEALRERLEAYLDDADESGSGTDGDRRVDGSDRAWLRAAAWAAWQAMECTAGGVNYGLQEIADARLADALTAEADAWDAGDEAEVDEAAPSAGVA